MSSLASVSRSTIAGVMLAATMLVPGLAFAQAFQTSSDPTNRPPPPPVAQSPYALAPPTAGDLEIEIGTGVILPYEQRFYGVTAIAIQEDGDEPCKVELYGRLLDPTVASDDILVGTAKLNGCTGGRNDSWRAATLIGQPDQFVRGLQTCHVERATNIRNKKLKGMAVVPVSIHQDSGQFIELPMMPCIDRQTPHCFARPNCSAWSEVSLCGSGEVLTSLSIGYFEENDRPPDAFFKVQPYCKRIERVITVQKPTDKQVNPGVAASNTPAAFQANPNRP